MYKNTNLLCSKVLPVTLNVHKYKYSMICTKVDTFYVQKYKHSGHCVGCW